MRLRPITLIFVLAGIFSTGSQWDIAQLFAWGRMIANYSQDMSLVEAVKTTFEADNMCQICQAVCSAKQDAGNKALAPDAAQGRPILFLVTAENTFLSPFKPERTIAPLVLFAPEGPSMSIDEPPRAV